MTNQYQKLKMSDSFGNPIEMEYSEIGSAYVYGYERKGSWFLYGDVSKGDVPCTFIQIKWKGKRKFSSIYRSRILHCPALGIYEEATDE